MIDKSPITTRVYCDTVCKVKTCNMDLKNCTNCDYYGFNSRECGLVGVEATGEPCGYFQPIFIGCTLRIDNGKQGVE